MQPDPVQPLVSVILPTHQRADRVAGAVASVQAQTHANLEIIVIDDGSTDGTADVLKGLAAGDARIKHLSQRVAGGAPKARNLGLDVATGSFVAFLDDDDRWAPTKIERQVEHLITNPDHAGVSCWFRIVDETKQSTTVHRTLGGTEAALLWFDFPGSFSFGLLRREGRLAELRVDEGMPACQDWDFYLRCAASGPIGSVPEVLCDFTVHSGPRITSQRSDRLGREAFIARHGDRMTRSCRGYHEAHLEMLEGSRQERLRRIGGRLLRLRAFRAGVVVALEWVSSSLGKVRRRPAYVDRTMAFVSARRTLVG